MSSKRYLEKFKIEAVKQIIEKRYPVAEVAARLGVATLPVCVGEALWHVRRHIFDYIEMFYNTRRRHGYNDRLSPVEFERRHFERLESV